MKKMFKIIAYVFCAMLVALSTQTQVYAKTNSSTANASAREYSIFAELTELEESVPYELYRNDITGEVVTITLEPKEVSSTVSLMSAGDSGWSGGNIPEDISTLTIKRQTLDGYYSYKAVVYGVTNSILDIHSKTYTLYGLTLVNQSFEIKRATALNFLPARASWSFDTVFVQYGITLKSFGCYLDLELNNSGQVRVSWANL